MEPPESRKYIIFKQPNPQIHRQKHIIFKQPDPKFADENGAAIKSRPTQYSIVKGKGKSFRMCPVSARIKSIFIGLSEVPPGYAVGFQFI